MLQTIKNTTRTVLAAILAVTVAATFYPTTAFADTDYEAAYNQANATYEQRQAETQTAYTEWQNAVTDRDNKKAISEQADADYNTANAAVEPAFQEMLKRQRILDYKTRQAIEYYAQQAWNTNYPGYNDAKYYDTESRINYLLSKTYPTSEANSLVNYYKQSSQTENNKWNTPGQYYRAYNPDNKGTCPQGFTTSSTGTDDTTSLTLYEKYVYFSQSYNTLMLSLDYFDEMNAIRETHQNSPSFGGNVHLLVSPYIMLQSSVNAPMNKDHYAICEKNGTTICAQNLAFKWGDVNCAPNNSSTDPYTGLFYAEESSQGGHYNNILAAYKCAGISCSYTKNDKVFEQDFLPNANATGYTVSKYRSMINNYVSNELSAYNSAKAAYEQAVANAEAKEEAADAAFSAYSVAKNTASQKETAYNNAATAEAEALEARNQAYDAWQNWLNNQNTGGGNTDPGTEPGNHGSSQDPGTTPDPTEPTQPTDPAEPTEPTTGDDYTVGTITNLKVVEKSKDEAHSKSSVTITWDSYPDTEKYYISTSTDGTNFSSIGSTKNTQSGATINWDTTYYFKVEAEADYNTIAVSNVVSFRVNSPSTTEPTTPTEPTNPTEPTTPTQPTNDKVTGVRATEKLDTSGKTSAVEITCDSYANAGWYTLRKSTDGKTFKKGNTIQAKNFSKFTDTNVESNTTYYYKIEAENASGNVIATSDATNIKTSPVPTVPPAAPKPTVGKPSITKITPVKKSKKADIWFSGAKNAKSYKVEIRRIYQLKGKKHKTKKTAVTSWKTYTVSSPNKTGWVYKKKISAKTAKKYKGNANYKLTKSGKKYKLYHKEAIAPVTATKLTRWSIYEVRVTAVNGSATQTVTTQFTIK